MSVSSNKENWIALDWGTSSLRAWLLSSSHPEEMDLIDFRSNTQGVKFLNRKAFGPTFKKITRGWLNRKVNPSAIIACGMIGSNIGWKEAPYLKVPGRLNKLSNHLTMVDYGRWSIHIVPGLSQTKETEIIRGEESLLLGLSEYLLGRKRSSGYWAVIPGTHSKWIKMNSDRVDYFTTYLTGELFEVIKTYSVLKNALEPARDFDLKGFELGLSETKNKGLASSLFKIRSSFVLNKIAPNFNLARLSGQLISEEIKSFHHSSQEKKQTDTVPLFLIGNPESRLISLYQKALEFYRLKAETIDATSLVLKGLAKIKSGLTQI